MWWLEFDEHLRQQKAMENIRKKHTKSLGGFSEADWEAARKAHKEKMKNGGS